MFAIGFDVDGEILVVLRIGESVMFSSVPLIFDSETAGIWLS